MTETQVYAEFGLLAGLDSTNYLDGECSRLAVAQNPVKGLKGARRQTTKKRLRNVRNYINGEGASSGREGAAVNIDPSTLGQISQHTAAPSLKRAISSA